jgi:hypothetical protein
MQVMRNRADAALGADADIRVGVYLAYAESDNLRVDILLACRQTAS